MYILDHTQSTFFCLGKFLKKIADDQCFSRTKGGICYMKHVYIQPFSLEVDWPKTLTFNGSIYCFIFALTAFLICEAATTQYTGFSCGVSQTRCASKPAHEFDTKCNLLFWHQKPSANWGTKVQIFFWIDMTSEIWQWFCDRY